MHNWQNIIREELKHCGVPPAQREEVVLELAAHLDECYAQARSEGFAEEAALQLALQAVEEVKDWHALAANIRDTRFGEGPLNQRTKSFWLPAFLSMTVASLFWFAAGIFHSPSYFFTEIGLRPQYLLQTDSGAGRTFYFLWLLTHILFGALGAFFSRRAGGARSARIVAGAFPAMMMFGLCGVALPITLLIERKAVTVPNPAYLALGILLWMLAPAIALGLGAAPFLQESKVRSLRSEV
jgi:hypothetical protein